MARDDITLAYLKKQVKWLTQKVKELEATQTKGTTKEANKDAN